MLAGVPKPRLYLLPGPHPRALSAGRGTRGAAVAVSSGVVALLSPAELEGVLAHELAKIHNRDVTVQTPLVVLSAMVVELSRIGGWLERALLMFLGPISAAFLHLMLSTKREFAADRVAAGLCGSPHGLADALLRLEQTEELFPFESSPATEPLYTINPFDDKGLAALFDTHPPVAERVRRLRALDPNWREKLRAA
jgi:heat shock protein HtpX